MHRRPLLDLLDEYAHRHPDEAHTVERFLEFVNRNARCFERDLQEGHVTGSAWLVNASCDRVLLTHHRKLGRWLQLGGHSEGDPEPLRVAMREAGEESGLDVRALSPAVFDLDIHEIPARRDEPAHLHYDVRFSLQVIGSDAFEISSESLDLAWVPIHDIETYTNEESVLRMVRKWRRTAYIGN